MGGSPKIENEEGRDILMFGSVMSSDLLAAGLVSELHSMIGRGHRER